MKYPKLILPIIVASQFCCTSLWFAGNAVMPDLIDNFNLQGNPLGHLTSAVQFGFILGTLLFAILTIADRFPPSKVFFICAVFGALCNIGIVWEHHSLTTILLLRFLTGIFLAGIYPVGMKIAADYYEKGLGKALSFLVGALVIGTAFPHLAKNITDTLLWKYVLVLTSSLAVIGGLAMLIMVPNGPYRTSGGQLNLSAFMEGFRHQKFRSAAFGYFGHMWELYAFWAFIPTILKTYHLTQPKVTFNSALLSFLIIGIGGLACVIGGYLSQHIGPKRLTFIILLLSCSCCLISPLMFTTNTSLFISFLLFWGMVVVADSPLFSTLVAKNVSPDIKGTALTIVNCIGFSITIISIQGLTALQNSISPTYSYMLLALGPILGLIALYEKTNKT